MCWLGLTNRTEQATAKRDGLPWVMRKAFNSAPHGTWSVYNAGEFKLQLSVNGEIRQEESSVMMIHSMTVYLRLSIGDSVHNLVTLFSLEHPAVLDQ